MKYPSIIYCLPQHTPLLSLKPQLHCLDPLYILATFKSFQALENFDSILVWFCIMDAEMDPTANQLNHHKKLQQRQ